MLAETSSFTLVVLHWTNQHKPNRLPDLSPPEYCHCCNCCTGCPHPPRPTYLYVTALAPKLLTATLSKSPQLSCWCSLIPPSWHHHHLVLWLFICLPFRFLKCQILCMTKLNEAKFFLNNTNLKGLNTNTATANCKIQTLSKLSMIFPFCYCVGR